MWRHADIARFHEFYNLVFLTLVFQFQVLGIEIECGLSVILEVEGHLVANGGIDTEVDFLIEVEIGLFAVSLGNRGVVGKIVSVAELEFR